MSDSDRNTRDILRLSTLLLGSTMTVMAGATIAPALPQINIFFQATPHAKLLVKLLLSIHALFIALSAPFMGILMDKYGRKPVLLISVALYGVSGSSGFLMDSLNGIMLGRAFLGISVAGIMSGFTTLIGDYFSGEERNKVMGLQAAFTGFGGLLFLSMGGYFADFGWRYPFLIYLFAFVVLPGVVVFINEPLIRTTNPDSAASPGAANGVPIKLLVLVYLLAFFGMLVFYMVPVQLPFHLKEMGDVSNARIGIALGLMTLVGALTSTQFKRIKQYISHPGIYAVFTVLMGTGYIIIYLASNYRVILSGLVIAGVGFGLLMPNVNVWLMSFVPGSVRGKFVGGLTTSFLFGQFVSPVLLEPLVQQIGVGACFGLMGCLLLAMTAGLLLYPHKKLTA